MDIKDVVPSLGSRPGFIVKPSPYPCQVYKWVAVKESENEQMAQETMNMMDTSTNENMLSANPAFADSTDQLADINAVDPLPQAESSTSLNEQSQSNENVVDTTLNGDQQDLDDEQADEGEDDTQLQTQPEFLTEFDVQQQD